MPTYDTTPNMGLSVPRSLQDPGPDYSVRISANHTTIDNHNHAPGSGARIPADALAIAGNVSWGGYSITSIKTTNYTPQSSIATTYSAWFKTGGSGDFWITNGSGTQVQITSGGGLNTAGLIASIWPALAVSTNLTIAASDTYSHYRIDTSAARTITLPSAAAVGAGRFVWFTDVTGGAATNHVTIARAGSDTIFGATSYKILSDYGSVGLVSDGVSAWSIVGGTAASQLLSTELRSSEAISIRAADVSSAGSGNHVTVRGGANSGAGTDGGVRLNIDATTMIETTEVAAGRRVVSLCQRGSVTTTQLPANTGDGVVFVADAATAPTDSPSGGVLVYSTGGVFAIRNDVAVASRWTFPGNLTTTAPTNGTAAAPPAQPDGYLTITHNGTTYKLAAYRGT